MTEAQSRAARDAARAGRYQLLLGAGASVGARNQRGPLPAGNQLVVLLRERFTDAPIGDGLSLPRAYQRAVSATSEEEVWQFLRSVFAQADHEDWFGTITTLPWRRAWTLNVDDTFDRSFRRFNSRRRLEIVDWQDPYVESGDLQVIHLHGRVTGNTTSRLIFSLTEYQASATAKPVWYEVLGGLLATEPFVIAGARMLDDPDMEAALVRNKPTANAPSIVVDPYIDPGAEWELEKLGYRVVKESAQDFFRAWQESFSLDAESLQALRASQAVTLPQFSQLRTNQVAPPPRSHDLYSGDHPVWWDAVHNNCVEFAWIKRESAALDAWLDARDREASLRVIYGNRLSGTSSGIFAIAKHAVRMGMQVLFFDRSTRWDPTLLVDAVGATPTLVLIDGGADFADDLDRTLSQALETDAPLYVICTETGSNALRLEGRLQGGFFKEIVDDRDRRLTRSDAWALDRRLDSIGRLGELEFIAQPERVSKFAGSDVFSAMINVGYGDGFSARLRAEVRALGDGWPQRAALILGLAAQAGRPTTIPELARAIGVDAATILAHVESDDHVSTVVEITTPTVRARHRDAIVKPLMAEHGSSWALDVIADAVRNLAPLSNQESLRRRNRAPMLVGHLMTFKNLRSTLGVSELDDFYRTLLPTFGTWSGRFWEQRALCAKHGKRWPIAESFARRAVSLYDDSFTQTTLGTILINSAEGKLEIGEPGWFEKYAEAWELFDGLVRKSGDDQVSSFAYLRATMSLVEAAMTAGTDASRTDSIIADWNSVYSAVSVSSHTHDRKGSRRQLDELYRRWEGITRAR